jgi:hypothetical protein
MTKQFNEKQMLKDGIEEKKQINKMIGNKNK